jgi:hypothetical protein
MNEYADKFFRLDALSNVKNEIIFSLLQRYNCFAGCQVCYTKQNFKDSLPHFQKYIPTQVNADLESQWYNIFEHFSCVSSVDDIYWMKHKQNHLYKWYQNNDHLFEWGNMTDNNFVRSQPLFINEFSEDTTIYEITFSVAWLDKVDINDIENKLDVLFERNGINKIKFIFDVEEDYHSLNFKRILDWTYERGIHNFNSSHHNFLGEMRVLKKGDVNIYECASQNGELFNTLNQSDYLQYDYFFNTLQQAIDVDSTPYYTVKEFSAEDHLSSMLIGKVSRYGTWAHRYNSGEIKVPHEGSNLFKYFDWVSQNITVNKDFNFIPIKLLDARYRYYHKLKETGWVETKFGLLKSGTETPVPILNVKVI